MPSAMNMNGFKDITVAELQAMMKQDSIRLVDVRTDAEIAQGKIPQGEVMPLHLVPLKLPDMDKNATTIFYCRSGGRSAQAAAFAAANGFADVYNLRGGIIAWANAGMPVRA